MRLSRSDIRKLIIETLITEGFSSSESDDISYEFYTDSKGFRFKVGSDGTILLVGRGKEDFYGENMKSLDDNQKVTVAKNIIKDQTSKGSPVDSQTFLYQIANSRTQPSPKVDSSSKNVAEVYLFNFPDAKPLSTRAYSAMHDQVGDENAEKMKTFLSTVFPQGHGGVYLKKSNGKGFFYDFGCYHERCKPETNMDVNIIDRLLQSALPGAFGAAGEVRRYPVNGGLKNAIEVAREHNKSNPKIYSCGKTTDEYIDRAIQKADQMFEKVCIQYSLLPRLAAGKSYNCGTFAITIATLAKTGKVNETIVQYANDPEPGNAIEPAARDLSALG